LYFIWKQNKGLDVAIETSIRKYKPSQNREKYMNLPWEIDARNAEKKYIDRVMKEVQ
tara:strand:- start:2102 stop:2272 length:171 start_codon:yes stop_codon:yes gene_type:complete